MAQRLSIEKSISIKNHPEFNLTVGSEYKANPKAVWVFLTTWATTSVHIDEKMLRKLNVKLLRLLSYQGDDFVFDTSKNIIILNYALPNNHTNITKHCLSIDMTFFQKHSLEWGDYNLQESIEYYIELIIEELKKESYLNFYPSRKTKNEELIFN
jgi:hypothetical protein